LPSCIPPNNIVRHLKFPSGTVIALLLAVINKILLITIPPQPTSAFIETEPSDQLCAPSPQNSDAKQRKNKSTEETTTSLTSQNWVYSFKRCKWSV